MISCVSSHRKFGIDPEIDRNQSVAKRTWEQAFTLIVYMGPTEERLQSGKTRFVASEDFPTIKSMMEIAGSIRGFTALINADIVVKPEIRRLVRTMMFRGQLCASSRRYHFDPDKMNWDTAELGNDRGRDIFIARSDIWKHASRMVPPELRIGNGRWDAWLTDLFRSRYDKQFLDFTAAKMIFHPIHGSRKRPYDEEIAKVQFNIT